MTELIRVGHPVDSGHCCEGLKSWSNRKAKNANAFSAGPNVYARFSAKMSKLRAVRCKSAVDDPIAYERQRGLGEMHRYRNPSPNERQWRRIPATMSDNFFAGNTPPAW